MEKNQFFYTRTEQKGEETVSVRDSFNVNLVIRSLTMDDGRVLVLLNDIHERSVEVPDVDVKTNKVKGYKRERNVYQSEIYLSKEDGEQFYNVTKINN